MICCCPGCRTGFPKPKKKILQKHSEENCVEAKHSLHVLPKDPELLKIWIKAIRRENFEPNKYTRICSKHFPKSAFILERRDTNSTRNKKSGPIQRNKLKSDAIPTIFPDIPKHLQKKTFPERKTTLATSDSRLKQEILRHDSQMEQLSKEDKIENLTDIKKKLSKSNLPKGINENSNEDYIILSELSTQDLVPTILYGLKVNSDLTYSIFSKGLPLPIIEIKHICSSKHLSRFSDVNKILSYLKNRSDESKQASNIKYAIELLEESLYQQDFYSQNHLGFLIEQLHLHSVSAKGRRYSPEFLGISTLWHNTSPALYNQIRESGMIYMPTESRIRRITNVFSVQGGVPGSTMDYLKSRVESLSEKDKLVSIIIEEVYSSQRVEFSGGNFFGCDSNGNYSKTILCFMVKSVLGNYSDMVAMVPITNISSSIIKQYYMKVLQLVTKVGLEPVATITDAHASNRKFYVDELGDGRFPRYILNPFSTNEQKIFMLFGPIHILKKFFNNFTSIGKFSCPSFENEGIILEAEFEHVKQIYNMELGQDVKLAHKLSHKVISSQSVEKCNNDDLSLRFFHESTLKALSHYASKDEQFLSFKETGQVMGTLKRFWNCVNLNSNSLYIQKNDDSLKPISVNEREQIIFLVKFAEWIKGWEEYSKKSGGGLSPETFHAAYQTSIGLAHLVTYLLDEKNVEFVFLCKINSDPIEKRFGWYRQLSGGNYYISCRQFFEAEKIIRVSLLLKSKIKSISSIFVDTKESNDASEEDISSFVTLISSNCAMELESLQGLEPLIYFVCGYVTYSILKPLNRECCTNFLSSNGGVTFSMDELGNYQELDSFINEINRGGFKKPSDIIYLLGGHLYELLQYVFTNEEVRNIILSMTAPRSVFVQGARRFLSSHHLTTTWFEKSSCSNNHLLSTTFFNQIASKLFNIFAKNFVSEANSQLNANNKKRKSTPKKSVSPQKKLKKEKSKKEPSD
ncbi:uncharacterized protein [Lepeophtheirus salmonis]|uniref:uncharacterized protein n=1 Tax=Lepeophtheirus salmonis TaxID=72036 RepID=UPI001AEB421D|nr:uncharacterized protein LOC121124127 [Lepeophtheirus salmonis]